MNKIPFRCVVDARVVIKLFIEEEFSDKTQSLVGHLASETPAELHAPICFTSSVPISCSNTHVGTNALSRIPRLTLQI